MLDKLKWEAHRATFILEDDFRNIRSMGRSLKRACRWAPCAAAGAGFNAVRIPFGYWIVTGPAAHLAMLLLRPRNSHNLASGELYVGPGLDFLDRALMWCQRLGLQVLLDLHGAPGGESGERPCGRERKDWRWEHWRLDESIEALKIISRRFQGHPAVSGIAVCNEPSEKVPADVLCQFYDEAVRAIRAYMPPDEVSIMLPVYRTERLDEIWRLWTRAFDGFARHANVAFDLHLYHCFGAWWRRQGLGSHLRMTKRHRKILRRVPAVVGEWSLALPDRALAQSDTKDQAYKAFAAAQLDAYGHASHGWFFWNWCDSPDHHPGWDARTCIQRHWLAQADLCKSGASLIPAGGV
ncbi:exgA [Symbiodinium natans]|uniref:glucan 1,3-beta-glucosidase n=1 Tax=Symbiodinium natans TaxID=878477 RepID=A0A812UKB3_9DINO|nr:exgA [Symbiodinium natans]